MFRVLSLCFFGTLALLGEDVLSPKQDTPEAMASKLGMRLPPRPWHLANVWWEFEKPTEKFERLEVEVTIDRDVPDSYNLYVAPVGLGRINGLDFYGGLQTNINGWVSKKSRTRVHPGMGAGYEGAFCSVRRPFRWGKGTYVYSIAKGKAEEGKSWFNCSVRSKETGETTDVGGLLFEGTVFSFWARHSAFVEVYATSKIPRSGIPRVNVTFGYPLLNGSKPKLRKSWAYHPSKGSAGRPACAKVRAVGEKVEVEVGPIFRRNPSQRSYPLKLAP